MASETSKPITPQAAAPAPTPVAVTVRAVASKPVSAPPTTSAAKPAAAPANPPAKATSAPTPPAISTKNGNNPQKSAKSSDGAKPSVAQVEPTAPAKSAASATPAPKAPVATPNTAFKLPAAVYSPQLLESVIYDIQYYLDWYRQNQIRKQVGAGPKAEPNHADETAVVIEAWLAGEQPTLESLEALLDHLKGLQLPEIHLTLAALPNRTQRAALVDWFRNNGSPDVLISFVADRNLGGGLVVRTPNHVFDFTWKQQLVAGRDKLAGILKRV